MGPEYLKNSTNFGETSQRKWDLHNVKGNF